MSTTHFEIPKSLIYKAFGILVTVAITLCIYIYQGDERTTRAQLHTNQQAIQSTLDGMEKNRTSIAVGKEKMNGHVVNPLAHVKNR